MLLQGMSLLSRHLSALAAYLCIFSRFSSDSQCFIQVPKRADLVDLADYHFFLPGGASDKEPACQIRKHKRCRFSPWVGKIPQRRSWQPTPVFLPGEFHRQRSLVGYSPLGCKASGMTAVTQHTLEQRLWHKATSWVIFQPLRMPWSPVLPPGPISGHLY